MNESLVLRHVVRVAALVAALAPLVVAAVEPLPWEWAVSVSAVALTAGEIAQRIENFKTLQALEKSPPE